MRNHNDPRSLSVPVAWRTDIDHWIVYLKAAHLSPSTVAKRYDHVTHLARDLTPLTPNGVTSDDLLAWAAAKAWRAETRHAYYCSVRNFFRFLCGENSPAAILPSIRRQVALPRPAPESVLRSALDSAPERERLILLLAAVLGLRAHEIASVHSDNVFEDLLGYTLRIHGKGGRSRDLPLPPFLAREILSRCHANGGFAFAGQHYGHLSPHWVSKIASRQLEPPWTLHTLRHRFATRAYAAERDLLTVQQLLGHQSVATTQRYAQPPPEARITAITAAIPDNITTTHSN